MIQLITTMVTPLVDNTEAIRIVEEDQGDRIVYKLSVAKEDMGKVIGKGGRTAKALRTLVHATAKSKNEDKSITLDIVD
ncbi:KH domain-containing protein [Bacillus fonticola]|uniref:KH domain-containing protein n=1 Tax=Bacillus fonticola TaxID=2728853 RepID=UPI0014733BBF|nr:KH domain-containing protein [Bacillus fonticola]